MPVPASALWCSYCALDIHKRLQHWQQAGGVEADASHCFRWGSCEAAVARDVPACCDQHCSALVDMARSGRVRRCTLAQLPNIACVPGRAADGSRGMVPPCLAPMQQALHSAGILPYTPIGMYLCHCTPA
jgi:hypothetical protein